MEALNESALKRCVSLGEYFVYNSLGEYLEKSSNLWMYF